MKHEIYAAAFSGHLFYDLYLQGRGDHAPPPRSATGIFPINLNLLTRPCTLASSISSCTEHYLVSNDINNSFKESYYVFSVNSTFIRQTLRANNRNLAKTLESVRRELKMCQQEKLEVYSFVYLLTFPYESKKF